MQIFLAQDTAFDRVSLCLNWFLTPGWLPRFKKHLNYFGRDPFLELAGCFCNYRGKYTSTWQDSTFDSRTVV